MRRRHPDRVETDLAAMFQPDPPDHEPRPDQCDRLAAALKARDVLHGLDPTADDVLAVADWILTGTATVALAFADQNARNYRDEQGSPDAARWTPET